MLKKIKIKIKKNLEIIALSFLIFITIIFTSHYNYNKKRILNNYSNLLHNIYFKKSLNHLLNNLEPRFKKIEHKINEIPFSLPFSTRASGRAHFS